MSFFKKKNSRINTDPTAVDSILKSLLKKPELKQGIARYKFVLKWEEIVGKELAMRTRPEAIRGKRLTIEVESSSLAQEVGFHKGVILKRLKKHLDDGTEIEDINFRVKG